VTFTVVHEDAGFSSDTFVLKDSDTGKKLRVSYTYGLGSTLGDEVPYMNSTEPPKP